MNQEDTLLFTRDCILKIQENFRENPTLYLSESDIQCDLFSMLLEKLGEPIKINKIWTWGTNDGKANKSIKSIFTRRIHSEFLIPEGRIDLAILDLNHVKFAMNSRGRNGHIRLEEGNHIFIEIKSSRTNRSEISSKNKWNELILKDIEKLNKYSYPCFMLCFDFQDILEDNDIFFLNKKANKNIEVFYCVSSIKDNYFI